MATAGMGIDRQLEVVLRRNQLITCRSDFGREMDMEIGGGGVAWSG